MMKHHSFNTLVITLMSTALFGASACAFSATTDIANAPLASTSSTVVKPNIMFVLDDSGSMSFTYLPDTAGKFRGKYGYLSSQCNAVYYNPNITYLPPLDATGTSYLNASFNAARSDGFDSTSATVDLGSQFIANRFVPEAANTASQYKSYGSYLLSSLGPYAAYYYTYSGTQTTKNYSNTNSTFYKECISSIDSTPGSGVFTKVTVGAGEQQNFANWYSYYRTRMLMMKTSASRAFSSITNSYRVGYLSIDNNTKSDFLNIGDFDNTQKAAWYAKLFAAIPSNGTPLRSALSTAGLIYGGQMNGNLLNGSTVTDPTQYSCQQNFTILSTDGYWNTGNDSGCSGRNGAGCQLDKTSGVGNQDGTAATPLKDGLKQSDTLADVAYYYYQTDLRTTALGNCTGALGAGTDVCENNVPGSGADINIQQHMTTFTLGLGVNGSLGYTEDYLSGGSSDYNAIVQGTLPWPAPVADTVTAVDDLWHAAVNGRGTYFSAQNPDSLVSGLSKALAGVSARTGSASAAATSNLEPVAGDNYVYIALYRTVKWDGDLQAKTIDPATGAIAATPVWSAQPLLDAKVSATSDTRTIYTFDSSAANKLKSFTWTSLNATEQGYFNSMCSPTAKLSQCSTLTAAQQTAASGQNLVNFIRGQNGYEDQAGNTDRIYRDREHVLGDMISSQPVYVKAPPFSYVDTNYDTFKNTTQKNRTAMVYVAVNDGMLHAFDGSTGAEQWAYIPPILMPNLYKLADKNYSANHQYYVDGSPTIGDICPNAPTSTCTGAQWKTILVGGLNAGGRGYYALDITDPASPKALWNFTAADDADLGYTFGNPIITKRKDGTWVVVFTSGYNNVSTGDGIGHLYVLNANTGVVLEKISTGTGDTTTPSGLAKINAWINTTTDNTAERFYGGDLLGNVWRFDIDDVVPPVGKEAFLLATVGQINGAGTQSITTKPELTEITAGGINYAIVNVGTGRYLGVSDLADTSQQSVYSFKDNLTATGLGQVRTTGVLVPQTLTTFTGASGEQLRTSSTNTVDWATKSGWYVDLNPNSESPGERVNVDMQMQLGLLTVAGNVPNSNACNLGGYAWLYYFDYKTGQYVPSSTSNMVGKKLSGNALVAGLKTIKLTSGKTLTIITDTGGNLIGNDEPSSSGGGGAGGKRVSWRELIN
ncbi:MAG: pilus assembly protein [Sulfuricella sp.]